jgi:NAD(P)H dehydrogenase (quinone)
MNVLVTHHSRTESTGKLAEESAADTRRVDGLIAGLPSYYGTMASEMKCLFDRVITGNREKTAGKFGAAFSTAGHPTGGRETTMVAGFVVVGDPAEVGGHFGVGCVGAPDEHELKWAVLHGERVAALVKRLGAT